MPKEIPNKRYTPEFKKVVVETMRSEHLSVTETMQRFYINNPGIIKRWERIYLEKGPERLAVERRGRANTGCTCKLSKEVEEDLIAEVAYLKNLQALVLERERRQQKKASSPRFKAKI